MRLRRELAKCKKMMFCSGCAHRAPMSYRKPHLQRAKEVASSHDGHRRVTLRYGLALVRIGEGHLCERHCLLDGLKGSNHRKPRSCCSGVDSLPARNAFSRNQVASAKVCHIPFELVESLPAPTSHRIYGDHIHLFGSFRTRKSPTRTAG